MILECSFLRLQNDELSFNILLTSRTYILPAEYFPSNLQPGHSQCSPQRQKVVAQVPRAIPILR